MKRFPLGAELRFNCKVNVSSLYSWIIKLCVSIIIVHLTCSHSNILKHGVSTLSRQVLQASFILSKILEKVNKKFVLI